MNSSPIIQKKSSHNFESFSPLSTKSLSTISDQKSSVNAASTGSLGAWRRFKQRLAKSNQNESRFSAPMPFATPIKRNPKDRSMNGPGTGLFRRLSQISIRSNSKRRSLNSNMEDRNSIVESSVTLHGSSSEALEEVDISQDVKPPSLVEGTSRDTMAVENKSSSSLNSVKEIQNSANHNSNVINHGSVVPDMESEAIKSLPETSLSGSSAQYQDQLLGAMRVLMANQAKQKLKTFQDRKMQSEVFGNDGGLKRSGIAVCNDAPSSWISNVRQIGSEFHRSSLSTSNDGDKNVSLGSLSSVDHPDDSVDGSAAGGGNHLNSIDSSSQIANEAYTDLTVDRGIRIHRKSQQSYSSENSFSTFFMGVLMLTLSYVVFVGGIYVSFVGKIVPPFFNVGNEEQSNGAMTMIEWIWQDQYYSYLIPLSIVPVIVTGVILNWIGMKLFRHN